MGQQLLSDLTDDELVQSCLKRGAKDDRPFQELLRRYQTMVWRICYSYTRNSQDAEDLTQEVFLKVYRSLKTFAGRSSLKTWIARITINTCQNEKRRLGRRPQLAAADIQELANMLPAAGNVEKEAQARQQQALLAEALGSLPADAYEILCLKDIEQRPYAEIADALGISVSAAKMRVQRARLALQASVRSPEW